MDLLVVSKQPAAAALTILLNEASPHSQHSALPALQDIINYYLYRLSTVRIARLVVQQQYR